MPLGRLIPRRQAERDFSLANYESVFVPLPNGFGLTAAAYNSGDLEGALKNAASWACIRVLTDALARSPMTAVRELNGLRTPVNPVPRILARPSDMVGLDVWRGQLGFSMVTDGNAFGHITSSDAQGHPLTIELIDPCCVKDRKVKGYRGTVKIDNKEHALWPDGDIWHLPGEMVMPGTPFALSPVDYSSKVIGTSLAAEQFSYGFFTDGGHPPVALISQVEMNGDQSRDFKEAWQTALRGTREPVVMGSGIDIKELHLDPSETKFIELMHFCVEQACRFWGVPPSMVFASVTGQHMTYANVTQADLHFLKHALEGKYIRLENAFTDLLPGNSYTAPSVPNTLAVIDRNAVLKADVKSRYDAHAVALQNRFKSINEVRGEEDDPPFDDPQFDEPGVPPFVTDALATDIPTQTTQPTQSPDDGT